MIDERFSAAAFAAKRLNTKQSLQLITFLPIALTRIILASVLLIIPICALGQDEKDKDKSEDLCRLALKTYIISVQVQVNDAKESPVMDLDKDDFIVYEDGVEQKIVIFAREEINIAGKNRAVYSIGYEPPHNMRDGALKKVVVSFKDKNSQYRGVYYPMSYIAKETDQ